MLSIVIPVFNTEPLLINKCLNSILNETRIQYEVLLIDDGSCDSIANYCDEYQVNDTRVRVIHKQNEGVSVARNIGIDEARGEWIIFVDADDWIEEGAIYDIYTNVIDEQTDIFFFGHLRNYPSKEKSIHCRTYLNNQTIYHYCDKISLLGKTIAGSEYGEPGAIATCFRAVWSVLFRKSLLKKYNIKFAVNVPIGEDLIFRLWSEYYAKRIKYIDLCFYHYRHISTSASTRYREEAVNDSLKELSLIWEFITENRLEDELKEAYQFRIVEVMTVLPRRCFFHRDNPHPLCKKRKIANSFYNSLIIKENVNAELLRKLPIKRRAQAWVLLHKMYWIFMATTSVIKAVNNM